MKIKNYFNFKIFVLAFQMAFIFCFFIGIFWHSPVRIAVYNENSHYYINRGFPISWAGISDLFLKVNFPIIKAPFLAIKDEGKNLVKVIDLSVFLSLFLSVFLVNYIIFFILYFFIFSKDKDKDKIAKIVLAPVYIFLTLVCIFFYFYWFPQV